MPSPPAAAQTRVDRMLQNMDADGDGKISRDKWLRRPPMFKRLDTLGDGFITREELEARFGGGGPGVGQDQSGMGSGGKGSGAMGGQRLDGQVGKEAIGFETLCGIGRGRQYDNKLAIQRDLFETGLKTKFPDGLDCPGIDKEWAISRTHKRDRENYHGGIDMPAA
ncbi:MAG: hypothetical protein VW268_12340 [Rhodospirillaceae bacterium]